MDKNKCPKMKLAKKSWEKLLVFSLSSFEIIYYISLIGIFLNLDAIIGNPLKDAIYICSEFDKR